MSRMLAIFNRPGMWVIGLARYWPCRASAIVIQRPGSPGLPKIRLKFLAGRTVNSGRASRPASTKASWPVLPIRVEHANQNIPPSRRKLCEKHAFVEYCIVGAKNGVPLFDDYPGGIQMKLLWIDAAQLVGGS